MKSDKDAQVKDVQVKDGKVKSENGVKVKNGKVKANDWILLLAKKRNFLVKVEKRKKLHTDLGMVDLDVVIGKNYGEIIKTHNGNEFAIIKPSILDFLNKKTRMLPQAIRPKDSALILAYTGLNKNSIVVEAGTGSAWLALFLSIYVGKIYSYEKRKDFFENAKKNVKLSKIMNIVLKNKDITKGIDEKNVDAVILDMQGSEKVVSIAYKALKPGGWLVVYSPYIEQVKAVVEEIGKYNFTQIWTLENILRPWDVRQHTLPKRQGLLHTGFLTFARKIF